jgi:replicative DNA helicase
MTVPGERTLPHNLEAECSILGAILVHNEAYAVAAQLLEPRDFYRDAHRRIFERMGALQQRSEVVDFVTLKEELSRGGELDEVGGPAYISSLADGVPRATNVEFYARIVKEKAALRAVIYQANATLTAAYEGDEPASRLVDLSLQRFAEVGMGANGATLRRPLLSGADAIDQWVAMPPISDRVLPLGVLPAIDQQMRGGLEPGECLFNLARPGSLKTMLILNVLRGWLTRRPGEFFVLVELEMPHRQLIERLARQFFELNSETLDHRRQGGSLDIEGFKVALGGLHVVDDVGLTLADIEQRVRMAQRQMPERQLGGVVIDHCGLVRSQQGTSAYDRATATAIGIKQLARRLEAPVVAIVQANRQAAQSSRDGSPPEMEQARDSGAFEENADFMLSMSAIQMAGMTEYVTVKLVKNRRGKPWITQVGFDPRTLRMAELADDGSMRDAA